ncbi:MAG TPA: RMD1 family protein [Spirochaetota bacterium]|nr:RMD1 family protein [Spirochaetota bacterium]HPJ35221.1 RMD1 family protein [Spirochaetota bacterium]
MDNEILKCIACCCSKTFRFSELQEYFIENHRAVFYKDALHVSKENGDIFIFSYGVIVFWDISRDQRLHILDDVERFENEPLDNMLTDEFSYSRGEASMRIHEDHIYLESAETLEKLAVSHGIAQSLKLSELESYAWGTIDAVSHIPRRIAKTGKSRLKRRDLAKIRGRLFVADMDINLNYDLLDTPEFFWEYPEVESLYGKTVKYLDVKPRIEILDKKLTVIRELFNMLADEQNHKHSAVLEWIIIWLIAIEIILFVINELSK